MIQSFLPDAEENTLAKGRGLSFSFYFLKENKGADNSDPSIHVTYKVVGDNTPNQFATFKVVKKISAIETNYSWREKLTKFAYETAAGTLGLYLAYKVTPSNNNQINRAPRNDFDNDQELDLDGFCRRLNELFASAQQDSFDPETDESSQLRTLATWVRPDIFIDTDQLTFIQKNIAAMVDKNPGSMDFFLPILTDTPSTTFGYTLQPYMHPAQTLFLQHVYRCSAIKPIITLEIAAGAGLFSWRIPYAFNSESKHYVNELSTKMIRAFERTSMKLVQGQSSDGNNLQNSIVTIAGDCFKLADNNELKGHINAIYVQGLSLNPKQHLRFLELVSKLLCPGGVVYIVTTSPPISC